MWKKGPQSSTEPSVTDCEVDIVLFYCSGYFLHFVIEITECAQGLLENNDFAYLPFLEFFSMCWLQTDISSRYGAKP